MKYLFYEKVSQEKAKVVLIYNVLPPEEADKDYIPLAFMPGPENKPGTIALPYVNPETNAFWYEYQEDFSNPEAMALYEVEKIKQENQDMMEAVNLLLEEME